MEMIEQLKQYKKIFIVGFIGSRAGTFSRELADRLGYKLVDIDAEIEKRDGRSIRRLCMMMGEHEYRNKEYEILAELDKMGIPEGQPGMVVACSDGIVLDDMNLEILRRNHTLFLKEDMEDMLENAIGHKNNMPYAFLAGEDKRIVKDHFCFLYESRKKLYNQLTEIERT